MHRRIQAQDQTNSDAPDLKSATDDAIAPYLTSLPKPYTFTQDHTLNTVRLALGYSAVLIAGVLFAVDYKHGWDVTKPYTLPACIAYFILNGALTIWVWAVEGSTVFVGRREGGQKVRFILTLFETAHEGTPREQRREKKRLMYKPPS
jgi:hypothetical protein